MDSDPRLQASWMTMVAHGVPVVQPPLPIPLTTTDPEYIESNILTITKEVSEIFKNIPYINAFSGILTQIINIREVREPTAA